MTASYYNLTAPFPQKKFYHLYYLNAQKTML